MGLTLVRGVGMERVKTELGRMLSNAVVDPDVRQAALAASAGWSDDRLAALFDWVTTHTRYVKDPADVDLFTAPALMVRRISETGVAEEDCDGLALLMAGLAGALGYRVRLALLDVKFQGELTHAIAQVYSDKLRSWLDIDVTATGHPLGWKEQAAREEYVYAS